MQMTQLAQRLGRSDVKIIGRDRFLISMFIFVLYIAVVLRFLMPWANVYLAEKGILPNDFVGMSFSDFYPLLVSFFAVFDGALLVGTIFGFMLIDEKDHNTLKAMLVTPVPLNQYVLYRIGGAVILAFFIIAAMVLFIGQALLPLWQLLFISAGAALTAPIAALFFGAFADNKVEGIAYSKFVSIAGWVIILGWFVPEPWQWLFGLFPPFLISKAYWMAYDGDSLWWLALILGIILQAAMIYWLMRRFNKAAYR